MKKGLRGMDGLMLDSSRMFIKVNIGIIIVMVLGFVFLSLVFIYTVANKAPLKMIGLVGFLAASCFAGIFMGADILREDMNDVKKMEAEKKKDIGFDEYLKIFWERGVPKECKNIGHKDVHADCFERGYRDSRLCVSCREFKKVQEDFKWRKVR